MFWRWLVIWVVLLLASAGYLAVRGWGLWGRLRQFGAELQIAQQRADALAGQVERLQEPVSSAGELAVFADPARLRAQRRRDRLRAIAARRARRDRFRPGWARGRG
ncbi:MAG TPA: hypothetical protein VFJ97_02130 [Dermatophilaceae bacterium]|nr:hypothetical protein [Dermatophilaceae bacterium]